MDEHCWKGNGNMQKYQRIKEQIEQADAILVSASNGFSIAEGLHIFADDAEFQSLFGVFKARYGIRSILQGLCLPRKHAGLFMRVC